jgi:hypothetical protein
MMYQGAIVATMDWLYPLSGGAIVGLTGMGGGSLMTPLLILLFGVHPLTAVGTDLLYAAVTKTAGTAIHSKKGNVDWRVAGLLAAGSVPTTVLTIWVLSRVPKQSPTTAAIISMSMGVALIIAAVAIFLRGRIRDYALARADNPTRTRYSGGDLTEPSRSPNRSRHDSRWQTEGVCHGPRYFGADGLYRRRGSPVCPASERRCAGATAVSDCGHPNL